MSIINESEFIENVDLNKNTSDKKIQDEKWKDWRTNTYSYTVDSIEELDMKKINEYVNKIRFNIKNKIAIYSEGYLNECIMYIELITKGSYEYIDLLENIGAYYPHKEGFIECLRRLAETKK